MALSPQHLVFTLERAESSPFSAQPASFSGTPRARGSPVLTGEVQMPPPPRGPPLHKRGTKCVFSGPRIAGVASVIKLLGGATRSCISTPWDRGAQASSQVFTGSLAGRLWPEGRTRLIEVSVSHRLQSLARRGGLERDCPLMRPAPVSRLPSA